MQLRFFTVLFLAASLAARVIAATDNRVFEATKTIPLATPEIVEDLGDLRPLSDKPLIDRLNITATTHGEYVSNARLSGQHGSGDFLFLPSLTAEFNQAFAHGLSLDVTVRAESFIYTRFSEFSFWGFSNTTRLNYQPSQSAPVFYVAAEPYWYASVRTGSRLADAFGISTGVEKTHTFNRDRTMLFASYNFSDYVSSPGSDDRDLHRFTVGVTHQLRASLYGQLYYSFELSDFQNTSREDLRHLVGLNLVYKINTRWTASAGATFVNNHSPTSIASYQNATVGAGLSLQF